MTRSRAHPPAWRWLLYRVFYVRLPYTYRWRARDDILGRWFYVRNDPGHLLFYWPISIGLLVGERATHSAQNELRTVRCSPTAMSGGGWPSFVRRWYWSQYRAGANGGSAWL
jgi:hypothetical protein